MAKWKKKVAKWKESWFYLQNPTANIGVELLPFSTESSRPRNLKALPQDEDATEVAELMKRGQQLRRWGLVTANLYTSWLARHNSPLKRRPHLMCAYTGPDDLGRDYHQDLTLDDLRVIMPVYTAVQLVTMDEGMLPFTTSNQAPAVSTCRLTLVAFKSLSSIF